MEIVVPVVSLKKINININVIPWAKSYIFASSKVDIVKFKRRNRALLFLFMLTIINLSFFQSFSIFKEQNQINTEKFKKSLSIKLVKKDKNEDIPTPASDFSYLEEKDAKDLMATYKKIEETEEYKIKDEVEVSAAEDATVYPKRIPTISKKRFFVQIASVYDLKAMKKKLDVLDDFEYAYTFKDVRTKKGRIAKKVLVGPFESYDSAKSNLSELNDLLKVKGFIRNES